MKLHLKAAGCHLCHVPITQPLNVHDTSVLLTNKISERDTRREVKTMHFDIDSMVEIFYQTTRCRRANNAFQSPRLIHTSSLLGCFARITLLSSSFMQNSYLQNVRGRECNNVCGLLCLSTPQVSATVGRTFDNRLTDDQPLVVSVDIVLHGSRRDD